MRPDIAQHEARQFCHRTLSATSRALDDLAHGVPIDPETLLGGALAIQLSTRQTDDSEGRAMYAALTRLARIDLSSESRTVRAYAARVAARVRALRASLPIPFPRNGTRR